MGDSVTNHGKPPHGNEIGLKDYPKSIVCLGILVGVVVLSILTSLWMSNNYRECILMIISMICSILLGWALASLVTPIEAIEKKRFPKLIHTLGAVVSGFTLAKVDQIALLIPKLEISKNDPQAAAFFVLSSLTCFFAAIISTFVFRWVLSDMAERQKRTAKVERRKAREESQIKKLEALGRLGVGKFVP